MLACRKLISGLNQFAWKTIDNMWAANPLMNGANEFINSLFKKVGRKIFMICKSIPYIKICPCVPSLGEDISGCVVGGEVLDVPDIPGHGVAVFLLCWYVCSVWRQVWWDRYRAGY